MEWNCQYPPKVLLLGNGILRLAKGIGWLDLLKDIDKPGRHIDDAILAKEIPSSMWVEALYGNTISSNLHYRQLFREERHAHLLVHGSIISKKAQALLSFPVLCAVLP